MSREPVNADLQQAYAEASFKLRIRNLKVGVVLAFILMSAFSGLDLVVYPDQYWRLAQIRLVCDLFLALLFLMIAMRSPLVRYIRTLGVLYGLLLSLSIGAMILIPLDRYLGAWLGGLGVTGIDFIIYAIMVMIISAYEPRGIWGIIEKARARR